MQVRHRGQIHFVEDQAHEVAFLAADPVLAGDHAAGVDAGLEDLGPGGRDLTRLAESSPEMWTSLLDEASEENLRAIKSMQDGLDFLRTALSERSLDEVAKLMRATREWRMEQ